MITANTLSRLEFDKVLALIAATARSEATIRAIHEMKPLDSAERIRRNWGMVEEIRQMARQRVNLRISHFDDIRPLLELARPEGSILQTTELLLFIPVLDSLDAITRQLLPRNDCPLLKSIEPPPTSFNDILEPLKATLDDDANILDTASPDLFQIRKAKRTLAARVRRKLEEFVRKNEVALFLQDDFITIRSGRWVVPVRMDSKGMVQGVVHDVSASGETAFMEPLEIIPFVNELENLSAEEKAEEIRILRQITAWIREDADQIGACFVTLTELDRLDSIADFAEKFGMSAPELDTDGKLHLLSARHPLLLAMHGLKTGARPVQPLDLELGTSSQVLVISGPNAGGKTIALKTVGLITAMALSGIPVPASPSSSIPLIDTMLVDIGDEQSIEQSLSTFSAHMAGIADILEKAGSRSLVLLDELGTGTEPLQGAAIACAVLNELNQRGVMVLATTHLTEIVGFVQRTDGMQNAGMEFDSVTWTPLYRLVMGEPGQSHAVETARRYGLPESVLAFARELLGDTGTAFAGVIEELRQKRNQLADEISVQRKLRQQLEDWQIRLQQQEEELESLKLATIEKGRQEARDTVSATRRELNMLLEQFRQERRKETADRLRQRSEELETVFAPSGGLKPVAGSLVCGMTVYVKNLGRDATVISLDSGRERVRVRAGSIELEVPLKGIELKAGSCENSGKLAGKQRNINYDQWFKEPDVCPSELKLIGRRVDEALAALESYIDQAVLSDLNEIRIIHGIGNGTLRNAVREFLGRHPQVVSFRPGAPDEGRDGATIVSFT